MSKVILETALEEWIPLAEQGDLTAQFNVGAMYKNGQGVPQDDQAAAMWYEKAAEQGDAPDEQDDLGEGLPLNIEAVECLKRSQNSEKHMRAIIWASCMRTNLICCRIITRR